MERFLKRRRNKRGEVPKYEIDIDLICFYRNVHKESGMSYVNTRTLSKYVEIDREIKPDARKRVDELTTFLIEKGYNFPPVVMRVNKISGRALIHDGNHRIAALKRLNIKWTPLCIQYDTFLPDGYEIFFPVVPKIYESGDWPINPRANDLGFNTVSI